MKCNTKDLITLFESQGVFLNQSETDEILSFDSLTFVTLIIEIENYYKIEIPDEYMLFEELNTINKVKRVINELLENKERLNEKN